MELAENARWLLASRSIQGLGAALMIPATGVKVAFAFADKDRGKAIGIFVGIAAIFLSMGPLLGGLLTHYLSWQ